MYIIVVFVPFVLRRMSQAIVSITFQVLFILDRYVFMAVELESIDWLQCWMHLTDSYAFCYYFYSFLSC